MKEQKLDRFSVAGSCKTETGMYDPRFEHDNCGIGAVVNIKGIKTHATVECIKDRRKLETQSR